jgi:hypothetical protein
METGPNSPCRQQTHYLGLRHRVVVLVCALGMTIGFGSIATTTSGQTNPQPNPFLPGGSQPGAYLGQPSLPAIGAPSTQITPSPYAPGTPSPATINPFTGTVTPPANSLGTVTAPGAGGLTPGVYSGNPYVGGPIAPGFANPNPNLAPNNTGILQPGVFQSGVAQPPIAQPGIVQPGVGGIDPFAPQVPVGYPNLPPPQASIFRNPFANPPNDSASIFAAPQADGFWSGGLLNNPNANGSQTWSPQSWQRFWQQSDWHKLWHAFRVRHTYIRGGTVDRVQINDSEIATSLSLPNFLGSEMPLTISPGFVVHNWQGPNSITGNDLPGSAYSAYLSFDHSTPLDQQFGGELNFTTGVYSDFETFTQHSLRFTGVGLLWMRLSPVSTVKLGVEYLDRVEIKLLPAGGLFWTPDPNTRLSFYFPRPKFAKRFPNFGNVEVWGYVSGEYGGGSWTINRAANFKDQVDLNDMRVMAGLEWIGVRGVTGFGEVGYVFERQLIYRSNAPDDSYLGTAIMFRGGFAF